MAVPERATDKPFQMPIEDVFSIAGRGTVVTGRIEQGGSGDSGRVRVVEATMGAGCDRWGGVAVPSGTVTEAGKGTQAPLREQ